MTSYVHYCKVLNLKIYHLFTLMAIILIDNDKSPEKIQHNPWLRKKIHESMTDNGNFYESIDQKNLFRFIESTWKKIEINNWNKLNSIQSDSIVLKLNQTEDHSNGHFELCCACFEQGCR